MTNTERMTNVQHRFEIHRPIQLLVGLDSRVAEFSIQKDAVNFDAIPGDRVMEVLVFDTLEAWHVHKARTVFVFI